MARRKNKAKGNSNFAWLITVSIMVAALVLGLYFGLRQTSSGPSGPSGSGPVCPSGCGPSPKLIQDDDAPISVFFAPGIGKTPSWDKKIYSLEQIINPPSTRTVPGFILGSGYSKISNLQYELAMIQKVIDASKNDSKRLIKGQNPKNPYKIRYSVYNFLFTEAQKLLNTAIDNGVYVQILIETSQTDPCLNYNLGLQIINQKSSSDSDSYRSSKDFACWEETKGGEKGSLCSGSVKTSKQCDWKCSEKLPTDCAGGNYNPKAWKSGGTFYKNITGINLAPSSAASKIVTDEAAPTQWVIPPPTASNSESGNLSNIFVVPILSMNCQKSPGAYPGIMHTKMRIFNWLENKGAGPPKTTVITGSLNPDDAAFVNEETLLIIRDPGICSQYEDVYNSVLNFNTNSESQSKTYINKPLNLKRSNPVQLYFSKGNVTPDTKKKGTYTENSKLTVGYNIVNWIQAEKNLVLIFVYTITEFGGLVAAIEKAANNGAFVMVMTDLDQIVGELGFGAPNRDCLMTQINSIPLHKKYWLNNGKTKTYVPVYACKNNNGQFSAFHHKNMIVGVDQMKIVTDTANWTSAAVGWGSGDNASVCNSCDSCYAGTPTSDWKCCIPTACTPAPTCASKSTSGSSALADLNKARMLASEAVVEGYKGDDCYWQGGNGNVVSSIKNCETTLFINSYYLDNNSLGNQFLEVYFYLIKKYWTFTMSSICKIQHYDGTGYSRTYCPENAEAPSPASVSFSPDITCGTPGSPCGSFQAITGCYETNKSSSAPALGSLCGLPKYERIPHVYSPSQIGEMMNNIGNKNCNKILCNQIDILKSCEFNAPSSAQYGKCQNK